MNKVFKVIWNEARNAYVVVSEIAKNRGSKSCSTKKLLAMLIATGVMTCASFDVLAAPPSAAATAKSQYVAFGDEAAGLTDGQDKTIDGHKYIYDAANKYWVREGYILKVEENGKLHTPLSAHGKAADVAYIGGGDTGSILQSVTSMVSASGTVTNMGESLSRITASAFTGVSRSGGTAVVGDWNYIIQDSSWKGYVENGNFQDGYVDLIGPEGGMPKGFVTVGDKLKWDDTKQAYTYNGKPVDYSNVYVIDGKIGVFTNQSGSDFYKGTVFGKNNEILMTVKDGDHFYSYWAAEVTDPSATMQSYRLAEYKKDLAVLVENDNKLSRDDIKEVTLDTSKANSATISLLRNGDKAVDGAITVTSGGGTEGSDTFVKISNGTANQTFATGSKVEAIGTPEATAGIKINGQEYTIKSGSVVSVAKDASNKTTTITVDGKATTITDTDTTYTAGDGIEINGGNAISVSKNLTGMQSIQGAGEGKISFDGANVKVNNTTFSENSVVVGGGTDGKTPVIINGTDGVVSGLHNTNIGYTDFATKGNAATEEQLKKVMDAGWKFTTDSGTQTTVTVGEAGNEVKFNGDSANIEVTNNGKDIKVALKNDLTVDSVKAGDFFMDKNQGVGYADKAYITSSGLNANNQKITGVADGTNDTDAVNFGQLKETNTKVENLKVEAGKHTTLVAGENVQLNQENTDKGLQYTINAKDTTYAAGNGITISGANNEISVKVKAGENNLQVTDAGLELKKDLTVDSVKAGSSFMSATGIGYGDKAYITSSGLNANNQKITGVAAGNADTDAVNFGQLKETNTKVENLKVEAGKHTTLVAGENVQLNQESTDKGLQYTISAKDTTYAAGNGIIISGANNEISVKVKAGENNLQVTDAGLELKKDLTVDSVKADKFFMDKTQGVGYDGKAYITSSGLNANNQKITGLADGTDDTDAVNVGQLKTVSEVANQGWKLSTNGDAVSKVAPGEIVDFSGDKNISVSHNGTKVKVELNDELEDIKSISNGDSRINLNADSISISNGNKSFAITNSGIGMSYITADYSAKSIMLGENGTTISGGLNVAGSKITGVAAGTIAAGSTDAVNGSQLNDIKNSINTDISNKTFGLKDDKGSEVTSTLGNTVQVKGADGITSTVKDGALEIGLKLQEGSNLVVNSNGLALNTALTGIQSINGAGAGSISFADGDIKLNNKVTIDNTGKITGVADGTNDSDAVNVSQLNAVKAEASKKTTLSDGKNTTVTSVRTDGQTDYQVNVAGDLKDITSVSNGASKINLNADSISISNGNKSFAITNSGIGMSYIGADYTAKSIMLGENGTTISGGLNVAGSKITGVAAGTADTDAVNVVQLNAVKETANKGWKLKTNNGNVSDVKPGDEVEFDGDDNIKVSNAGNKVSFKLNNKLTGIESITGVGGSISFSGGNVTINNNVTFGSNGQIHNVTAGTASTDAVNVGQLNAAVQAGNTDTHIKPGEYGVGADNKVNMDVVDKTGTKINTVTITDVAKASDLGNVNNINNDLKNSNGTTTVVDAVNNLNQKLDNKVGDLQYSKVDKGDIADGDSTTTAIGKLDQALKDVADTANQGWNLSTNGGEASKVAPGKTVDFSVDKNIKISNDGTNVKVELNKDLTGLNSVTSKEANIGGVSIKNNIVDNLSNKEWDAKNTDQYKDSGKAATEAQLQQAMSGTVQYDRKDDGTVNKTQITLNKEGDTYTTITNVANGKVKKDSKDAINGGQLFDTETKINNRIDGVENQVISNSNRIGQLSSRVNKVGAGAAALAALHPMDFDPDDKLTFSAGYGNYAGQNAAAIGAYYRPDEKVMFSVGGTVGNGENMVNAGISFSLDRTNHVSNSRTALAREVIELRGQLAEMGAKMAKMEKAFGMLDETKTKLFPDVPANHWAYEYIAKLAGNGYIEGYPDGNFGGDRLMTRYEFATMLYRAIENGAALEERIIKEFEPELGRIRVDRISGEDGDRNKIERVRVNATKGERDHYGNKLAK